MRRIPTPVALVALLLLATVIPAISHHGPEEVVIDAAQKKKSAVVFPHRDHMERIESCDTCHHKNEGLTVETDAEVESCTSCHLDPEKEDTPSMREMSLKKNPFHAGCIDCHKAEKMGPTKCDDCHPKE